MMVQPVELNGRFKNRQIAMNDESTEDMEWRANHRTEEKEPRLEESNKTSTKQETVGRSSTVSDI